MTKNTTAALLVTPVYLAKFDKDVIIDGLEIELAAHKDALAQAGRDLAALRSQIVAQGELGTLCFHIEQAIENGCCPYDIEAAYEAYAAATQSK